jgi:hypothetical protein
MDPLLLDTLKDLRAAVGRVEDKQDELRDRVDIKVDALTTRVTQLETGQIQFRDEVKSEARKWGTIGGVATAITACFAVVAKIFAGQK